MQDRMDLTPPSVAKETLQSYLSMRRWVSLSVLITRSLEEELRRSTKSFSILSLSDKNELEHSQRVGGSTDCRQTEVSRRIVDTLKSTWVQALLMITLLLMLFYRLFKGSLE